MAWTCGEVSPVKSTVLSPVVNSAEVKVTGILTVVAQWGVGDVNVTCDLCLIAAEVPTKRNDAAIAGSYPATKKHTG